MKKLHLLMDNYEDNYESLDSDSHFYVMRANKELF